MKDLTPINVTRRGAPVLSNYEHAFVVQRGEKVVAIYIDMMSKRCEIGCSIGGSDGSVGITIDATEHSLHLDETKDREEFTEIYFPEFKGWTYWCGNMARYTCSICLVKEL